MGGACSTQVSVREPDGKSPLGIRKRGWEYNIKINLKATGHLIMERIHLVQDGDQWRALVNTVLNIGVPYKAYQISTRTRLRGVSWLRVLASILVP
jgi:hypothetical protein